MTAPDTALRTYLGVSKISPEGAVLRLLVDLGVQVVGADEGSLLVLDADAGDLVFAMTTGDRGTEEALEGTRLPLGSGITGLAAATCEVQIGAPTHHFDESKGASGKKFDEPEAVLAAPMLVGETLVGVITAVSFQDGKRFGSADATVYARVASIAGVVVQQRRHIQELERLAGGGSDGAERVDDTDEGRIVRAVSALAGAGPGRTPQVAALLEALSALLDADDES